MKIVFFQAKLTPSEAKILANLGNGNKAEGFRIALGWASHFYNLGLRDDLNLDLVGLAVRVNPELTLNWEDYQTLENASKTDLNGF